MSYQEDSIDWQIVSLVDEWLDREVSAVYQNQPLAQDWARIGKVIEELGEAIQALIGATGQNPRKGITDTMDGVLRELADTALTALFAMQHITKDTSIVKAILLEKQHVIFRRTLTSGDNNVPG